MPMLAATPRSGLTYNPSLRAGQPGRAYEPANPAEPSPSTSASTSSPVRRTRFRMRRSPGAVSVIPVAACPQDPYEVSPVEGR